MSLLKDSLGLHFKLVWQQQHACIRCTCTCTTNQMTWNWIHSESILTQNDDYVFSTLGTLYMHMYSSLDYKYIAFFCKATLHPGINKYCCKTSMCTRRDWNLQHSLVPSSYISRDILYHCRTPSFMLPTKAATVLPVPKPKPGISCSRFRFWSLGFEKSVYSKGLFWALRWFALRQ